MDLGSVVLTLGPDPKRIERVVKEVVTHITEGERAPGQRDTLQAFVRELTRMVLGAMARADMELLDAVEKSVHARYHALPPTHPVNRRLHDAEWVTTRLRSLAEVIATYRQTNNVARSLAVLSGQRRDAWRQAVAKLAEADRPLRAGDLVRQGVFNGVTTANNALHRMVELGLVAKEEEGSSVSFYLTWAGEHAADALSSRHGEAEPEPSQAPEPERPVAPRVVGDVKAAGFASEEMYRAFGQDPDRLTRTMEARMLAVAGGGW